MKSFKIMITFLLVSIFLLSGNAKADDIGQYYSLHNISQGVYYCSSTPNSQSSYGLCYSPTPYIYTDNLIGVRQQYDIFSTPKRICHKETGTCTIPSTWNPGGSTDPYTTFRIFVPPGTIYFFVEIYMPRDALIAAVARLGKPPETSTYQYPSYSDIPVSTKGGIIEDYRDTDIFAKNGGGHSTVVSAGAQDSKVGITGDWFYVKILNYGGGEITNIKYGTTMFTATLKSWWDTMTDQDWANLENGIVKHLPDASNCTVPSTLVSASFFSPLGNPITINAGGDSVLFDGRNTQGTTVSDYSWFIADKLIQSGLQSTFNYKFNTPGTYTANLIAKDQIGCKSTATPVTINVNAPPCDTNVTTNPSPPTITAGQYVTFLNASSKGDIFSWDFGDNSTKATVSSPPAHQYLSPNIYTAKLTVSASDNSCTPFTTSGTTVNVIASISVLTSNINIVPKQEVVFINSPTPSLSDAKSWSWVAVNKDGMTTVSSSDNTPNFPVTFNATGTYTISLKITDKNNAILESHVDVTVKDSPLTPLTLCSLTDPRKLGLEEVIYILQVISGLR